MNAPLDALAVHAEQSGDRTAVVVDAVGGARPSTTTFAELNAAREPARARPARRRARSRANGWCGAARTRSRCSPRSTRPASCNLVAVPLSYRFNAEEMAYVIDNSDATIVVVDAEEAPLVAEVRDAAPEGAHRRRVRRRRARRAADRLGRRDRRPARRPSPTSSRTSEAGAAMIYTSGTTGKPKGALRTRTDRQIVFALLGRAQPAARERGAPHHRAAVPLGPAGVRVAVAHARRADRRAAQVRSPSAWIAAGEGAPRHQHVLRADAAQAHRVASRPTSSRRPTCRR